MKFIYKIPHGYYRGGYSESTLPCVNASGFPNNNFIVWIEKNQSSSS